MVYKRVSKQFWYCAVVFIHLLVSTSFVYAETQAAIHCSTHMSDMVETSDMGCGDNCPEILIDNINLKYE